MYGVKYSGFAGAVKGEHTLTNRVFQDGLLEG